MWLAEWIRSVWPSKAEGQALPGSRRDRLAMMLGVATLVLLGAAFFVSKGTQVLMPGPLASAHGGIETCSSCHSQSGSSKLSWIHGLVPGDPLADSKACLTCHKMPDTAFNAHGASAAVLKRSTDRLIKVAASTPAPQSARAQNIAFPTHDVVAGGLACASCHKEHQGVNFNLNKISNEQCGACHVVKFDSFDGHHPQFDAFPFKRRTQIIYDHAGHFGKHFPEVAKKDPAKRIPETCSSCHSSREDKRVMAVEPFDRTCATCHLNQITGKERVSGPKGIAFLTVPGLDLQSLKSKNASIGEWPEASEAELSPFMKVMVSRDARGRALIKTVDGLNLLDLSKASNDQIKAVTGLVWEIKRLFHALISGKASDVLGDLNIGGGAKLSAGLVADLTASIPRDVVVAAQQQWLPNLAAEMASHPVTAEREQGSWNTTTTDSGVAGPPSPAESPVSGAAANSDPARGAADGGQDPRSANELPPPMRAGVGRPEILAQADGGSEDHGAGANSGRVPLPSGTSRAIDAARNKDSDKAGDSDGAPSVATPRKATDDGGADESSSQQSRPAKSGEPEPDKAAPPQGEASAPPVGGKDALPASEGPAGKATEQNDDLLFPTEDELRRIKSGTKGPEKAAQPEAAPAKTETTDAKPDGGASDTSKDTAPQPSATVPAAVQTDSGAGKPRSGAVPVISIDSDVDPESWADYGGWYRQDFAIFYRPAGHKDKFVYSWLFLIGPQAPKGDTSPAAVVFDVLTNKDAQGSCTKCHSVDVMQDGGRVVNFSQPSAATKQGRFTTFIHEPHFGIMENRGCLTCHSLEKGRPYLKSYEQGDPQNFASNFGDVKKELCQTCHTSSMARQDCLLCHKYHVNGVTTPIMSTKNPTQ